MAYARTRRRTLARLRAEGWAVVRRASLEPLDRLGLAPADDTEPTDPPEQEVIDFLPLHYLDDAATGLQLIGLVARQVVGGARIVGVDPYGDLIVGGTSGGYPVPGADPARPMHGPGLSLLLTVERRPDPGEPARLGALAGTLNDALMVVLAIAEDGVPTSDYWDGACRYCGAVGPGGTTVVAETQHRPGCVWAWSRTIADEMRRAAP